MRFDVTILGSGSATPTAKRNPSSQLVHVAGRQLLIDCGEGTQMQLRRFHLRLQNLDNIFISHLHGDHFFGLIGLLTSLSLLGRKKNLRVYGPAGLEEMIMVQLKITEAYLTFPLEFSVTRCDGPQQIFKDSLIEVISIPLRHRIPCTGFLIRELPRGLRLKKEAVEKFNIPVEKRKAIKEGADLVLEDGTAIANQQLTIASPPARSYAYCSDTAWNPDMFELIRGVDLLYHESTFAREHAERAKTTWHSTAEEAARTALQCEVKKLLIGHFSARYDGEDQLVEEARAIFPETEAATEGKTFSIPWIP